jgi:hypothetical protein
MKHQWMAYVIVALLAIGAGVAIAGLPDNVPVDATIVPPSTTDVPTTPPAPTTTAAPTTTTEAPATTDGPATTDATETTDAPDPGLPDRSEIFVIVANGANIAGAASRNVARLTDLGYTDIAGRDGTEVFEFTTIFFADGFEGAALRLAADLELLPEFVAPLADAPNVNNLPGTTELLAYIGIDRAG